MNSRSPPEKTQKPAPPRDQPKRIISSPATLRGCNDFELKKKPDPFPKRLLFMIRTAEHEADGQIKYFTSLTMVLLWGSITSALPHHMFLYFCIVWIFNRLYYICNSTSGVFKDIPKTLRNTILVTQKSMMLAEHRRELLKQILTSTIFPSPSASVKLLRNAESHTNLGPAASNSAL